MDKEATKKRLKDAINYLASIDMIDGKSTTKAIAADMGRNSTTIGAARAGNKRYLTRKFVNEFCKQYNGIISPDWIWDGVGVMITSTPQDVMQQFAGIDYMSLPKEKLVVIINELIDMRNRQQAFIMNEQERFMKLINDVSADVAIVRTKSRIDDILANPKFFTYLADAISTIGNSKMNKALSGADKKEKEEILRSVFSSMPEEEVDNLFSKVLERFDSIDVISEDE